MVGKISEQWLFLGMRARMIGKEHLGPFWDDDKVLYLAEGLNYMNVYIVKTQ